MKILVVDDEPSFRKHLTNLFFKYGYQAEEAVNGQSAIEKIGSSDFDIILLDLVMPDLNGMEVLKEVKINNPSAQVIVMTANATIETAIQSMKLGAYDYLVKPFEFDELEIIIQRAGEFMRLQQEHEVLQREQKRQSRFDVFIGSGSHAREVSEQVNKVAPTNSTVLITGATGTGKEIIAREIHRNSSRADKPFVVVNCGAIQETLLESEMFGHEKGAFTGAAKTKRGIVDVANKGTLFLDEIGEISGEFQKALLRFLESGEYRKVGSTHITRNDVRIVAATNRNLKRMMSAGHFREDLYYRLNVFNIHLKPLCDRMEDLEELVEYCLRKICFHVGKCLKGITPEALQILKKYSWPGNVRELENVIERAVILAKEERISAEDLPGDLISKSENISPVSDLRLSTIEKEHIKAVLHKNGWNKTKTAGDLGISKKTLYLKIGNYKIIQ